MTENERATFSRADLAVLVDNLEPQRRERYKQRPVGCLTEELETLRWRRRESNPAQCSDGELVLEHEIEVASEDPIEATRAQVPNRIANKRRRPFAVAPHDGCRHVQTR